MVVPSCFSSINFRHECGSLQIGIRNDTQICFQTGAVDAVPLAFLPAGAVQFYLGKDRPQLGCFLFGDQNQVCASSFRFYLRVVKPTSPYRTEMPLSKSPVLRGIFTPF